MGAYNLSPKGLLTGTARSKMQNLGDVLDK